MIAGGYNGSQLSTVEVLGEEGQNCKLPNLPKGISYVPSIFNHGNNIILCGGQHNENSCLRLDGQEWLHFNNLTHERTQSSAIAIKGQGSFIFGGENNKLTSEFLPLGDNKWQNGSDIDKGTYESCVVKVTDQELLIIGGTDTPYRILKYNLTSEASDNPWKELDAKLKQGRQDHACHVFNGKVIITGGRHLGESLKSTEILDLNSMKLKKGGEMNESRYRHGMGVITWKGKPILIAFGGRLAHRNYWKSVEFWNDSTETWTFLHELNLKEPKMAFGYATIPTDMIC